MGHWTYAAILGLAAICAGWLQLLPGVHVLDRPRRVLVALIPSAAFVVWDIVVTARGWWAFSERYTLGLRIFGMPVEEYLFFVVIPVCGLLTLEAVRSIGTMVAKLVRSRA